LHIPSVLNEVWLVVSIILFFEYRTYMLLCEFL
jgi:hypothetical protein